MSRTGDTRLEIIAKNEDAVLVGNNIYAWPIITNTRKFEPLTTTEAVTPAVTEGRLMIAYTLYAMSLLTLLVIIIFVSCYGKCSKMINLWHVMVRRIKHSRKTNKSDIYFAVNALCEECIHTSDQLTTVSTNILNVVGDIQIGSFVIVRDFPKQWCVVFPNIGTGSSVLVFNPASLQTIIDDPHIKANYDAQNFGAITHFTKKRQLSSEPQSASLSLTAPSGTGTGGGVDGDPDYFTLINATKNSDSYLHVAKDFFNLRLYQKTVIGMIVIFDTDHTEADVCKFFLLFTIRYMIDEMIRLPPRFFPLVMKEHLSKERLSSIMFHLYTILQGKRDLMNTLIMECNHLMYEYLTTEPGCKVEPGYRLRSYIQEDQCV